MDPERIKWMVGARQVQNEMCKVLGNRMYDEIDRSNLKNKVSFAIFGAPTSDYNEEQSKLINEITNKIISLSGERVYINFVYVVIQLQSNQEERVEVVIRLGVKKNGIIQPPIYLDSALRVYSDWEHFLETNKLPKCYMCYPVNGVYKKDEYEIVELKFGESHACDDVSLFLEIADVISTAGSIIGLAITSATLFTPIGFPIAIGALATSAVSGVYDVGRNVAKLTDLHAHDIGLDSSEAAMAWFGVLTSAAGVASVGSSVALKTAQKVGVEGATDLLRLMKILNISSVCINGLSVANGIITIALKCFNGNLENKDVLAFVLSCLFMFNAVISMTMAARMINEISEKHISKLGNVISMVSCTVNPTLHVNGYESYKWLLSQIVGLPAVFADSINLHKFECSTLNIIDQTISLVKFETDLESFASMKSVDLRELWKWNVKMCKKIYKIAFNPISYLKNANGQMVPRPLNIAIMHHLISEVRRTAENLSLKQSEEVIKKREISIMQLACDFDKLQSAKILSEFFFKVKFVCQNLEDKCQKLKNKFENKVDVAMISKDFNKSTSNFMSGIRSENLNTYFFLESIKQSTKEFKYWYINYNSQEKGSFKNNYFHDFEYDSVFPLSFPFKKSRVSDNEYFYCATKFSGMKIDRTTSEMFIDDRLVILNPLPKQPVPRVLFYHPENTEEGETYPVGIAVVQKKHKERTNLLR